LQGGGGGNMYRGKGGLAQAVLSLVPLDGEGVRACKKHTCDTCAYMGP
jgi:hypothetical protein